MSSLVRRYTQNRSILASLTLAFTLLNFSSFILPYFASGFKSIKVAELWTVPGLRRAALTPEESVHYRLDTVAGAAEWQASQPRGRGVVFPYGDTEPYRITMFHQLDCLATLRDELVARGEDPATPPTSRAHFCLNYMRETLTCQADSHLEMVRSEYGGRAVLPYTTRTDCMDWEQVWKSAEKEFDRWVKVESV